MIKYLFLLIANQSGSTVMTHQLAKCKRIVSFPFEKDENGDDTYIREGQHILWKNNRLAVPLPDHRKYGNIWTEDADFFSNANNYDWDFAKEAWLDKWSRNPKFTQDNPIYLEKSPPNVVRAHLLKNNFENPYFIVMVRNPFAHAEGICRRSNGRYNIKRTARHSAEVLKWQLRNIQEIKELVYFTYENLIDNTKIVEDAIKHMLPELDDIDLFNPVGAGSLEGFGTRPLENFNIKQFKNLSTQDIGIIQSVLSEQQYTEALSFFGYKVDSPI